MFLTFGNTDDIDGWTDFVGCVDFVVLVVAADCAFLAFVATTLVLSDDRICCWDLDDLVAVGTSVAVVVWASWTAARTGFALDGFGALDPGLCIFSARVGDFVDVSGVRAVFAVLGVDAAFCLLPCVFMEGFLEFLLVDFWRLIYLVAMSCAAL